jgi:hypothetical protein
MYGLRSKLVCLSNPELTSLLRNLSISCKLWLCDVSWHRPKGGADQSGPPELHHSGLLSGTAQPCPKILDTG